MTRITRRAALGATLAAPFIANPAHAQAVRLRMAHPHPESDSWEKAARLFAEQLKERTGGAVTLQVFGNGVLGSDQTIIASARSGALDIALTGNNLFTGMVPKLNTLDLSYLIRYLILVAVV